MSVLRDLYEMWLAFRDSYQIEFPEDATSDEKQVMRMPKH